MSMNYVIYVTVMSTSELKLDLNIYMYMFMHILFAKSAFSSGLVYEYFSIYLREKMCWNAVCMLYDTICLA